jgi:hypothetical protein
MAAVRPICWQLAPNGGVSLRSGRSAAPRRHVEIDEHERTPGGRLMEQRKSRLPLTWLGAFLLIMLFGELSSADAQTDVELGEYDLVLQPAADTRVRRWLPFSSDGRSHHLTVDGQSVPDSTRTLIRFSQAELEAAVTDQGFLRAVLEFTVTLPAISWNSPEVTLHRLKRSWRESDATWANVFGVLGLNDAYEDNPSATISIRPANRVADAGGCAA